MGDSPQSQDTGASSLLSEVGRLEVGKAVLRFIEKNPQVQGQLDKDEIADAVWDEMQEAVKNNPKIKEIEAELADHMAQFKAEIKRLDDAWELEFGESPPKTIEDFEAWQVRMKMGSGMTFSDDAGGDEMWGKIQGYLQGLRERARLKIAGDPENLFVANDFQRQILDALEGCALPKQKLADEVCGGEGTRLYRSGGINELKAAGKVKNKRRLGYYRPDAPPTGNVVN